MKLIVQLGGEFVRRNPETGDLESTVEVIHSQDTAKDGKPDWEQAGVCDTRGVGGVEGYKELEAGFLALEEWALLCSAE